MKIAKYCAYFHTFLGVCKGFFDPQKNAFRTLSQPGRGCLPCFFRIGGRYYMIGWSRQSLQKPVRHPLTRWVRRPGLDFGGLTKLIIIKYSCAISLVNTGKSKPRTPNPAAAGAYCDFWVSHVEKQQAASLHNNI